MNQKKQAAIDAINALFNDTTCSPEQTADALSELRDLIDELAASL